MSVITCPKELANCFPPLILSHSYGKPNGLKQRAECAKNWLEKYAPEEFKFAVQEAVPKGLKLSKKQKEALKLVTEKLLEKEWSDVDLHSEFYVICRNLELEIREFFTAAYNVLINKVDFY